ncbi:11285_t:CDS:2 [Diversispora eburnea]|uniref:11285_t:CDS:1 n=1 Tax=Diversispora eburnea TaxID=1213867 RepID=A0A9N8WDL9_9GLOM|nr:11285_t:CDS:2 [Diversispora eburnea]
MSPPPFPPEIYQNIFKLFDYKTLYKSIYVSRLWCLEYGTPVILDYHNLDQSLNPIFIKLENFSRLSKLKRFSCRADTTPELIYTISKVSRELLQIDIQQGSDDEALCALVNSQNNLQEFEMSTCLEAKKVLTAILKKSRTLRKITIVGGSMISFDFFFQCPNLEELTLKFPMKIPGSERKWVQYNDFENDFTNWNNNNNDEYHIHLLAVLYGQTLQYRNVYSSQRYEREKCENHPIKLFKLEIHRSYQNIIKIINLIKTSNSKLLILNLDLPNPKDPENYSHLLSTIINYCPNLVNINLYIPTQSLSFISNLFRSVIPRNIRFLALGIQTWKFQAVALDNFLQHCENRIDNLPFNFAIDTNCEPVKE